MFNKFIPNMNVIGVIVFIKLNFLLRTMKISLPSPAALYMGSYGGYLNFWLIILSNLLVPKICTYARRQTHGIASHAIGLLRPRHVPRSLSPH